MAIVQKYSRFVAPQLVQSDAIQNAGVLTGAVSAGAGLVGNYAKAKQQATSDAWVSEQLIAGKEHKFRKEQEFRQNNLSTPEGTGDSLYKNFGAYDEEISRSAPNGAARQAYLQRVKEQNLGYLKTNTNWEEQQSIKNIDATHKAQLPKLQNLAIERAKQGLPVDDLYQDAANLVDAGSSIYSQQQLALLHQGAAEALEEGELQGLIERSPREALLELDGGRFGDGTFDFKQAIALVEKNEGGFVASDGASGAPALFGINAKWWPEDFAKVKAIQETQGDAAAKAYSRDFYKQNFWKRFNVESLEGGARAIVLDGAVNHRQKFVKELVSAAQGGATDAELIQMRRDEYERLGRSPKHAPSLEGWRNRMDAVEVAVKGSALPADKLKKYKKTSLDLAKRADEELAKQDLTDSILASNGVYKEFEEGKIDLRRLSELEEGGETPLTKMIRGNLTKAESKKPKPTSLAKATAFSDLLQKKDVIELGIEDGVKISAKTLSDFKDYQSDVYDQLSSGHITAAQSGKLLNNYSQKILVAINEDKSQGVGNPLARGIQNPYGKVFKQINSFMKRNGTEGDALLKQNLVLSFDKHLGDYKSSGNYKADKAIVEQAFSDAKLDVLGVPVAVGTPNDVLTSDGSISNITNDAPTAKADASLKSDFTIMEDANGNKARVYSDGRIEEL